MLFIYSPQTVVEPQSSMLVGGVEKNTSMLFAYHFTTYFLQWNRGTQRENVSDGSARRQKAGYHVYNQWVRASDRFHSKILHNILKTTCSLNLIMLKLSDISTLNLDTKACLAVKSRHE